MNTYQIVYKTNTGRKYCMILADDKDTAKEKYYKNVPNARTSASISIESIEKKAFNVTRSKYGMKWA
jgi:hypothetical protein